MKFWKKENRADRQALEATTPQTNKTVPWWRDDGLLKLNILLFFPLISQYVQGYDASLINNVQQLKVWQSEFHHPKGSLLGIMSASYWVGNVLGVAFISSTSDRYGRRISMFLGSLLCLLGTGLTTGSVNAAMFIVGRLLLGIGGVIVGAIGPVLMAELAYPSQRATATALSNTQYSTGSIVAAWITFGSFRMSSQWAWRIPTIMQALPSILQAFGVLFMPESPRWLVSQGRDAEALAVLAKYHGNGNPDDEIVQYEFNDIRDTIELEVAARQTSWSVLWSTKGNRWRSFILIWCGICKQWSGNGLVSYYLGTMLNNVGITTEIDQTLITATSAMFSFACSMAFAYLPARVGRRPLLLWSMALMWIVFTLITILTGVFTETNPHNHSAAFASVAFIYLYSGVHNLGWTGAMMVYITEIMPYSIRAKGMALFWLLTGASGAFNTYVNPLGIDAFGWKFYWFYVGWIIVQFVVVYVLFIETKGPSLEQVALLFDGADASVSKVNPVAEEVLKEKVETDVVEVERVEQVEKR